MHTAPENHTAVDPLRTLDDFEFRLELPGNATAEGLYNALNLRVARLYALLRASESAIESDRDTLEATIGAAMALCSEIDQLAGGPLWRVISPIVDQPIPAQPGADSARGDCLHADAST